MEKNICIIFIIIFIIMFIIFCLCYKKKEYFNKGYCNKLSIDNCKPPCAWHYNKCFYAGPIV